MSDLDQEIVRLYQNGFPYKEIANRLGITKGKVDRRLHEIRKKKEVKRWWEK